MVKRSASPALHGWRIGAILVPVALLIAVAARAGRSPGLRAIFLDVSAVPCQSSPATHASKERDGVLPGLTAVEASTIAVRDSGALIVGVKINLQILHVKGFVIDRSAAVIPLGDNVIGGGDMTVVPSLGAIIIVSSLGDGDGDIVLQGGVLDGS
ncbi:hypothetical protein VTK56DRAFT_6580 [Thermocarpiscus australiensis]